MGLHTYPPSAWRKLGIPASDYRAWLASELSDGNTAAWYQPGDGVTGTLNASLWANWVNGTAGTAGDLAQALGANMPIYLSHTGSNYVWTSGNVAANSVTSPSQTIVGNWTLTIDVAMDSWSSAADDYLVVKQSGSDGFFFNVGVANTFSGRIYDGASSQLFTSANTGGLAAGSRHTVIIEWVDATGLTYKVDGVTIGSQIASTKVLTNAAAQIIFAQGVGNKVYRATLTNGAGTTYYDMNAALAAETTTNGATFTGGAGEVWTLNNTGANPAMIIDRPSLLAVAASSHWMKSASFTLSQPYTRYLVGRTPLWNTDGVILDGISSANAYLIMRTATPKINIYAGTYITDNATMTVGQRCIITQVFNNPGGATASSVQVNNLTATTGDPSVGNASGVAIGGDGTFFGNWQFDELIVRAGVDSAGTQARIKQLLGALHGISL